MMLKRYFLYLIIALIISGILGWNFRGLDFVSFFVWLLLAIGLLMLTILIGIINLTNKKKTFLIPGGAFICVIVVIFSSSFFHQVEKQCKKENAKQVVAEIHNYQAIHGKYPESLNEIPSSGLLPELRYDVYSSCEKFEVSYETSSSHTVYYLSDVDQWSKMGR